MPRTKRSGKSGKRKGIIAEFKEFISRGNVVDLAVGVVVGSAFTAIVNSLVNDIIMPFIGWLIGGIDFSEFQLTLPGWDLGLDEAGIAIHTEGASIMYGNFINAVINFFLLAVVVFIVVKSINIFRRTKKTEEAKKTDEQVQLLTEIRDLLQQQERGERDRYLR